MSTVNYVSVEAPASVAPTISERGPRTVFKLSNPADFLNNFVSEQNIKIYSEMTKIDSREVTNRKGEVTTLPTTVSYQLRKGFLNLTDTGSIYYKNNNKTYSVGYVKADKASGDFEEFVVKDESLLDYIA